MAAFLVVFLSKVNRPCMHAKPSCQTEAGMPTLDGGGYAPLGTAAVQGPARLVLAALSWLAKHPQDATGASLAKQTMLLSGSPERC